MSAISLLRTGVGVLTAVLFPVEGSICPPEIVAVFAYEPVPLTVAVIVRVADAALLRLPIFHTPVVELYEPKEGVAETNVYPDGNKSLTVTLVALPGPLLEAVKVKVTLDGTVGVLLFTVLVIDKSVWTTAPKLREQDAAPEPVNETA